MLLVCVLLAGLGLTASGCETVKGAALDVANTGNNIKDIVDGMPTVKTE